MRAAILRPPRLRTTEVEDTTRHASWTELFYDLVFVVAVANLASRLLSNTTAGGVLAFAGYFVAIWWAWAGYTFYADRYDTDDLGQRLLAVTQMVAIAAMASSIGGETDSSRAFALSYVAARIVLIIMYARARHHVPETRRLVSGYIKGFSAGAGLWLISVFVPEPIRFWLWFAGLAVSFATPYVLRKTQAKVPLDVDHLPERFGLFTILVLGELIAAVVAAVTHEGWSSAIGVAAGLAVAVAAGLWWIYFDNLQGSVVRRSAEQEKAWKPTVWIYSHLPLVMAITGAAVGLEEAVVAAAGHSFEPAQRWLLIGGVAVALTMMGVIAIANQNERSTNGGRIAAWRFAGAAVLLIAGAAVGDGLGATGWLVLIAVLAAIQVGSDVFLREPAVH